MFVTSPDDNINSETQNQEYKKFFVKNVRTMLKLKIYFSMLIVQKNQEYSTRKSLYTGLFF